MNWALSVIILLGLVSVSQGVILSLEESESGASNYRYFYLTFPDIDNNFYQKPYFTLVNDELSRPYGALGSLVCALDTDGIAVYSDIDGDDLKEWSCGSINLLPFANQGGTVENPPICAPTFASGTPALWNMTAHAWRCGDYNQILTFATRELPDEYCASADFLMYHESIDMITCVNPLDIDPALTLQTRDVSSLEERVDVNNDKKWHVIMSDMDVTSVTSRTWNFWRWTNHLNYDTTSGSSLISTPPQALPFDSTLLAVTFASFKVSGYLFSLQPPTSTDTFTGVLTKLGTNLAETTISSTLSFNSISATSGQVTFGFSGNVNANAVAGETFVAGIKDKNWIALPLISDRHMITVTLWIQTSRSFTQFWPLA